MSYADLRPVARRRGGFTLVELMIALVISGILVTVVFQMMSGQARLVAQQSAKEEVQQNVRGALEVVSADLRGAFAAGIVLADSQAIEFMLPRAWGIVCGLQGPNAVDAIFPVTGGPPPDTSSASGLMLNANPAGPGAGAVWVPALPARARITAVTSLGANGNACTPLNPAGSTVVYRIESDADLTGLAVPGNQLAAYHLTRYDLGDERGERWIRRSMGMNGGSYNMQPLAGPIEARGLVFRYFADGGAAPIDPEPGTARAQIATIRMLSVRAVTRSTTSLHDRPRTDSGTVRVMLRN